MSLAEPHGWRLLSSRSALLRVLRDGDNLGAQQPPRGTVLSGDLAEMQPCDLLNFLHQGRRTGVLLARLHETERAIVLYEGNVAWACSTSPGERLGELLAQMGAVDRALVDAALRWQSEGDGHKRIGELLLERGLDEAQLERGLRRQAQEIFLGLLVAQAGDFIFLRGLWRERLPAQLQLDTQAMLLDGLRRLDEMELYRTRLPSLACVPLRTARAPAQLTPEQEQVYAAIDGERDIEGLVAASGLAEFETVRAVYGMMTQGLLSL